MIIPRIQFTDYRLRHYGISEHTLYPLANHALASATLPYPASLDAPTEEEQHLSEQAIILENQHELVPVPRTLFQRELEEALAGYGKPIKTMGKSYREEPYFYYAIGACFHLYKERLTSLR